MIALDNCLWRAVLGQFLGQFGVWTAPQCNVHVDAFTFRDTNIKYSLFRDKNMKISITIAITAAILLAGCATLTNDENVPIAVSFSNGDNGSCDFRNKRQTQQASIPSVIQVRRSDDSLQYDCMTSRSAVAVGEIPSTIGGKIVASAVFLDFGIVDSVTDMHREYPASYVIPVER